MTETVQKHSISSTDRLWLEMNTTVLVGPLQVPDLDALRRAFCRLAELGERTRLGFTIDADRAHWRFDPATLPALAELAVIEREAPQVNADTPEAEVLELANLLLEQLPRIPGPEATRVIRAGNFLMYHQNHAIGDAHPILNSISALIQVAAGGDVPAWALQDVTSNPIRVAFANTFGPRRRRLAPLIRQRLATLARPARVSIGSPAAPVRDVDLAAPDPGSYVAVLNADSWHQVKHWRREHATEASMASIYLVMARRALRAVGVPVSGETTVLYDCRRHLPSGTQARGNLVVGFIHQLPDDAVGAGAVIDETANSGRVLLTLVSATLKRQSICGPAKGAVNPVSPHSDVAYVFGARHRGIETLPWLRRDLCSIGVSSTTSDVAGITLTVMFLAGRLSVSWSFHQNVTDVQKLQAATRLMETDPIRLLENSVEVTAEEGELGRSY